MIQTKDLPDAKFVFQKTGIMQLVELLVTD